jgi:T5orf172 domain
MTAWTGRLEHMTNEADPTSPPEPTLEAGPVQPTDPVRKELEGYLATDPSRVGETYRLMQEGLASDAIAERLEGGAAGAWQYRRMVRALVEGNLPTAPTVALAAARRYRTVLRTPGLSAAARTYLQLNAEELERRANDPARLDEEGQRASEQTLQAEARNEIGVYVYALPHYIRHPYDQGSGRTLLKVGHSQSDVIARFRNQIRTTALPEEPILLRIYRTSDDSSARAEAAFHRLLDAADHSRTIGRSAGREWFLTHTRFLDEIARTLGLSVDVINEGEFDDN